MSFNQNKQLLNTPKKEIIEWEDEENILPETSLNIWVQILIIFLPYVFIIILYMIG